MTCYVSKAMPASNITTRVESRLDDSDDLGHWSHFLMSQAGGSHLQTNLSECDLDF